MAVAFLAGLLLAAASATFTTASATADGAPTVCDGSGIQQDVSGDVIVPEHATCVLTNIAVHGMITVDRYATLRLTGVDVDGNVTVAARSTADLFDESHLALGMYLTHSANVYIGGGSTVQGSVLGTLSQPAVDLTGFGIENATVGGDVDISAPLGTTYGNYSFVDASIGGSLRLSGMQASEFDFDFVTVGGSLILNRFISDPLTQAPVRVCGIDVVGNATIEYTSDVVHFGDLYSRYENRSCPTNTIGGSLLLHDNTGVVRLTGSIPGNLVCRRNLHHPRELRPGVPSLAIKVGGRKIGQCAGLT